MRFRLLMIVAATAASLAVSARAQDEMTNVYLLDSGAFTNALMANQMVDRMALVLGKTPDEIYALAGEADAETAAAVRLDFRSDPGVDTPARLAESYPASKRGEAEATFNELLTGFGELLDLLGEPHDLASAAAGFIAGSYSGYTMADFPDENFKALAAQMRGKFSADAAFGGTSDRDRQETYEQLAIIGMLNAGLVLALREQPNADIEAKLRKASEAYLRDYLKVDPTRLRFTDAGMTIE